MGQELTEDQENRIILLAYTICRDGYHTLTQEEKDIVVKDYGMVITNPLFLKSLESSLDMFKNFNEDCHIGFSNEILEKNLNLLNTLYGHTNGKLN